MLARAPQESYTRKEVRRLLGITERQLREWEKQELVPRLDDFAFSDLIALRSLQKLRENRVSLSRIRSAVRALREKLGGESDPLRDLKIFCEGRKIAVLLEGQKMEPVSGQLLLDFDRAEISTLLAFPEAARKPRAADAAKLREAERWFERGLELEQTGAPPEQIIEAYEKAIEFDPSSAGAAVNLGTVYYHLQRWKDAEREYVRAVAIDATYALAYFNLGNLHDERGNPEQAKEYYYMALKLNPDYADAHYNLALLAQTHGEQMKAVRHWKAYLKLDGSSSWGAVARRELDKLCRAAVVPGARTV